MANASIPNQGFSSRARTGAKHPKHAKHSPDSKRQKIFERLAWLRPYVRLVRSEFSSEAFKRLSGLAVQGVGFVQRGKKRSS